MKDDQSILLLKTDKKGELDEIDLELHLADNGYISASLYRDQQGLFTKHTHQGTPIQAEAACVMALLSSAGALSIYSLSDLKTRFFYYEGVQFLPSILSHSTPLPRHWKGAEALSEVLIADLGDINVSHPYLLLRTNSGNVAIYDPFVPSATAFGFRKITLRRTAKTTSGETSEPHEDNVSKRSRPMKMAFVSSLFVVLVPGQAPAVIAKVATSSPRIYDFTSSTILAFSGHHTPSCSQGFVYVDRDDDLSMVTLASGVSIGHSDWVERKVELGIDVSGIAYLERTQSYVLAASHPTDFQLPQDDEWHADWKNEDATCLPQVEQGSVKLLSSTTFNIIDSFPLEYAERAMCIKSMNLELSEETHERKELIVVGTAVTKGEDMVARGCIYIFDVVDVVPQPGVPETDLKLKLIAKEEVKGAVTSLSRIGSQGFLLAAQGQKCMVRGLKEDLSILPVAFMDMKYYVNVAKELPGTGLCILGDAMNGLWFVGYSVSAPSLLDRYCLLTAIQEEPYKLQLFGRDQVGLEVMAAEFLPDGKHLYIIAADADGDLHVMQFDPESPESERGTKLLHRSTFHSGSFITTMSLLPRNDESSGGHGPKSAENGFADDSSETAQQILVTSQEGSISLITPLPEQSYRRLSALQNILTANLEHPCGLNPRAYRAVETDGIGGAAMVDGNLVQRWLDQDSFHQSSLADKVGSTTWELREDLNEISGSNLLCF